MKALDIGAVDVWGDPNREVVCRVQQFHKWMML